jgi:hypothetical protein
MARISVNEVINSIRQRNSLASIIKDFKDQGYSSVQINDAINQAKIKMELAKTAGMEEYYGKTKSTTKTKSKTTTRTTPRTRLQQREEQAQEEEQAPEVPLAPGPPGYEEATAQEYEEGGESEPQEQGEYQEAEEQQIQEPQYPPQQAYESVPIDSTEELVEEIIDEKWQEFKAKVGNIEEVKEDVDSKIKQVESEMKRFESRLDEMGDLTIKEVQKTSQGLIDVKTEIQNIQETFSKILEPLVSSVKQLRDLSEELSKPETKKHIEKKKEKAAKASETLRQTTKKLETIESKFGK